MPGFTIWPHAKKMDIEIPSSIAEPFTFIWKLPFKERGTNSYIKHYSSSSDSLTDVPQTVNVTVEYPFHYRYHPCQFNQSHVPVHHVDPAVFIDCRDAPLYAYSGEYDFPIVDQLNENNRPEPLIGFVTVGRKEDEKLVIWCTIGITLACFAFSLCRIIIKASTEKIAT